MSTVPYAFMPLPRVQFLDANGVPLSGGFLFSYQAGTSSPLATFHLDTLGNLTPNTNPVILDSTGTCEVRILPQSYKFVLTTSSGVQVWAVDEVEDIGQTLYSEAVLLNPVGAALQTIAGPISVTQITIANGTPLLTSNQSGTGILCLNNSPVITTPSINCLKATNTVTQTGDTSLHTIYTLPIPGGWMSLNNQMRVALYMSLNSTSGSPVVDFSYGGTVIGPPSTISSGASNSNGRVIRFVGGNVGATNSQSWDFETASAYLSSSPGNIYHTTSAVDSTATQNLLVTFQGGSNTDSITFYRCIVEIL